MNKMLTLIVLCIGALMTVLIGCSSAVNYDILESSISDYLVDKDAHVGVCVIIDGKDTVGYNMNDTFPMLSVYKFPIALALTDKYSAEARRLDEVVDVDIAGLVRETYSPMLELFEEKDTISLTLYRLLEYSLQQSDNNASDIILDKSGGVTTVMSYLEKIGIRGINVASSEAEMFADNSLCYSNFTTPKAMAGLFDRFDRDYNDSLSLQIKGMIEGCETGKDRLYAPLDKTGVTLGHKTGTGFILPDGRLMAINDAGYVHLPDGIRYSIAVFVADSGYDMKETSAIVAGVSEIVYKYLTSIYRER